MACTGQPLRQRVQPLHFSGSILYTSRVFTYLGWTVSFSVSVPILRLGNNRAWIIPGSALSVPGRTQGVVLDIVSQLFQLVYILQRPVSFGDLIQDLVHPLGTHPARRTFAAGFIYREFQEKFGDIHHTRLFIHNDQTAGAHHGADGDQVVIIDGDIQMGSRNTPAGRVRRSVPL